MLIKLSLVPSKTFPYFAIAATIANATRNYFLKLSAYEIAHQKSMVGNIKIPASYNAQKKLAEDPATDAILLLWFATHESKTLALSALENPSLPSSALEEINLFINLRQEFTLHCSCSLAFDFYLHPYTRPSELVTIYTLHKANPFLPPNILAAIASNPFVPSKIAAEIKPEISLSDLISASQKIPKICKDFHGNMIGGGKRKW